MGHFLNKDYYLSEQEESVFFQLSGRQFQNVKKIRKVAQLWDWFLIFTVSQNKRLCSMTFESPRAMVSCSPPQGPMPCNVLSLENS